MKKPTSSSVETSVFRSGNSDAVRIPRKFAFAHGRVLVRKLANGSLLIVPKRKRVWPRGLFESVPPVTDDFCIPPRDGPSPLDDARMRAIFGNPTE